MPLSLADANVPLTIRKTGGNPARKQHYRRPDSMMQKRFPELDESENAVYALCSENPEQILQQVIQRNEYRQHRTKPA